MGPKPVYTLWPYEKAGDSTGHNQRVDRLRLDGQTLYTQNIKAVGVDVLVTAVVEGFLIVIYQKALDNSGYKHLLTFSSYIPTQTSNSKRKNRKRDTSFGTTPHLARMSPLTSGVPSLSYLTQNSPRSMCYIRSLTETPSRSATVACQTSNKRSTATTNPFYTRKLCRQDLAIVEWKLPQGIGCLSSDRLDRRSPPSPDLRGTNRKFFQNKILKS